MDGGYEAFLETGPVEMVGRQKAMERAGNNNRDRELGIKE